MKVSRKVYYLVLIIEEYAEIIHRTCKAIRFGLEERWKPEDGTNRDLLEVECTDLEVVLALNREAGNLKGSDPAKIKEMLDRKRKRVFRYLQYSSEACHTVSFDDDQPNPALCFQTWKAENPE